MAKRGRPKHQDILTPREWDVLELIRQGLTNAEIAQRLGIGVEGVKYHVSEILSKLEVSTRQEAALWNARERGGHWVLAPLLFWRRANWAVLAGAGLVAVAASASLLAWALVRTPREEGTTATNAEAVATPAPLDVAPQMASQFVVVYVRPVNGPMADGRVRVIDARSGNVLADNDLGTMFSGSLALADTATATRMVTYGPLAGQALIRDLPVPAGGPHFPSPRSYQGAAVVGDILYQREGDAIVGRDRSGQVVARYAIPQPLPPRGDEPILHTTAIISASEANPSVILPASSGHLLAFIEGTGNSVLDDLNTGQRLDLTGYDRVFAATLAKDGYVYALIHNVWLTDTGFEVAKIDPDALRVVAQQPMDFNWRAHLVDGFFVLGTAGGDVFVYLPAQNPGACPNLHANLDNLDSCPLDSLLYRVDTVSGATTLVPLPPALGIDASVGVDGKLYFYGGFGQSRISRYDPATGQIEVDLPGLRTPEGTYVQTVLAR